MTKYYTHNDKNVAVIIPGSSRVSSRAIIGEAEWATLNIEEQFSALTALVGYGYTVDTTPSLASLTSPSRILKDIKDMKDVRSSLEVMGITYDGNTFALPSFIKDEKTRYSLAQAELTKSHTDRMAKVTEKYTSGVSSVVEELTKLLPPYPFIENTARPKKALEVGAVEVGNGYYVLPLISAKKVFDFAVSVWGKYSDAKSVPPTEKHFRNLERDGSHRQIYIHGKSITIGCQSIHRWQVEELGRQQGWDFTQQKDDVK